MTVLPTSASAQATKWTVIGPRAGPAASERRLAVGVVRVPGEPRSLPVIGPCEVRKEGSQRLEGLSVVIAGRASHVCTPDWATWCNHAGMLVELVHGTHPLRRTAMK